MQNLTPDEDNRLALAREIQRKRALRDAFVAVFGPPGQPNPPARIVLEYLDEFCRREAFSVALDNMGQTDVPRTFARFGLRQAADEIHRIIAWKEPANADRI